MSEMKLPPVPPTGDNSLGGVDRETAILHLVQELCTSSAHEKEEERSISSVLTSPTTNAAMTPHYYESLVAGDVLYRILHEVAPFTFSDLDSLVSVEEWIKPSSENNNTNSHNNRDNKNDDSNMTTAKSSSEEKEEEEQRKTENDTTTSTSISKESSPSPPPSHLSVSICPMSMESKTQIKGNLVALIRHMNDHARNALDAKKQDFNVTAMVNANTIVEDCTTSQYPPSTASPSTITAAAGASPSAYSFSPLSKKGLEGVDGKGREGNLHEGMRNNSTNNDIPTAEAGSGGESSSCADGWNQFALLAQLFVAMVALSGAPRMLQCLKKLPRDEQKILSNLTREAMLQYGLKSGRASVDRRGSAMQANRYTSPFRTPLPNPALLASSSAIGSASTLLPVGMDVVGGGNNSSFYHHTTNPTPTNNNQNNSTTGSAGLPMAGDSSHYRIKMNQLMQEVEEWKSRNHILESQYSLLLEEKKGWDFKYKQLLDEVEKEPSEDLVVLQANLAKKEESIEALHAKVLEGQETISAIKQASSVHQLQNENLKRKLKQQGEVITRLMEDRRAMESKVQLVEDRLEARRKAYQDLEVEAGNLRSELKLLQLSKRQEEGNGGEDGEDDAQCLLVRNASFTSTESVGRTLGLERELDVVRRQRDNFQKQIRVLQRQFAAATASSVGGGRGGGGGGGALPFLGFGAGGGNSRGASRIGVSPSAGDKGEHGEGNSGNASWVDNSNSTLAEAANDVLKAQVRQLEQERRQQKQQLKKANGRILALEEELKNAKAVATPVEEKVEEGRSTKKTEDETVVQVEGGEGKNKKEGEDDEDEKVYDEPTLSTAPLVSTTAASDANCPRSRELSVLTSLLLLYGYENAMLKQRNLIFYRNENLESAGKLLLKTHGFTAVGGKATQHGIGTRLLSAHRQLLEQGMINSTVNHYV